MYIFESGLCLGIERQRNPCQEPPRPHPYYFVFCDLNNISKVIWHLNVMQVEGTTQNRHSGKWESHIFPAPGVNSFTLWSYTIIVFSAYTTMTWFRTSWNLRCIFEQTCLNGMLKLGNTYHRCFRPNRRHSLFRRYRRGHAPHSCRRHKPRTPPVIWCEQLTLLAKYCRNRDVNLTHSNYNIQWQYFITHILTVYSPCKYVSSFCFIILRHRAFICNNRVGKATDYMLNCLC